MLQDWRTAGAGIHKFATVHSDNRPARTHQPETTASLLPPLECQGALTWMVMGANRWMACAGRPRGGAQLVTPCKGRQIEARRKCCASLAMGHASGVCESCWQPEPGRCSVANERMRRWSRYSVVQQLALPVSM